MHPIMNQTSQPSNIINEGSILIEPSSGWVSLKLKEL